MRSPSRLVSLLAISTALLVLLAGCGGGSHYGRSLLGVGGSSVVSRGTLQVVLEFSPTDGLTRDASAGRVLSFTDTSRMVVYVLDRTTHRTVVPPVEAQRPSGAQQMSVMVNEVPTGDYDVFVECFDAQGEIVGFAMPPATVYADRTVTVVVTDTINARRIDVTPTQATIAVGGAQAFTCTLTLTDASQWDITDTVRWTSDHQAVATVDAHGLATGVAGGTAVIQAETLGASPLTSAATLTVTGSSTPTPTPTPSWSSPATDLTPAATTSSDPQIALSADGTKATAVWTGNDGQFDRIQSASATISGKTATWGTITTLSAAGSHAGTARVTLSADGTRATAVWVRGDGTNFIVQGASATISGTTADWSGPVYDLSDPGQDAASPHIALSNNGTVATAIWLRDDGTGINIVQTRSATVSGKTADWSGPIQDLTTTSSNDPRLVASQDGTKATAVWTADDAGSNKIVQAASATVSGTVATWGTVSSLSTAGRNAYSPDVALAADGTRASAVWRQRPGLAVAIVIQSASATISGNTADWSGPRYDISYGSTAIFDPHIALSADGTKATAVWTDKDSNQKKVVQSASSLISGKTADWSAYANLEPRTQDTETAQVALSADGTRAVVVWKRFDGNHTIVQTVQAVISGKTATWDAVATDLSAPYQNATTPQVAVSQTAMMATAIWTRGAIVQTASYGTP